MNDIEQEGENRQPLVTIRCLVYNHEPFLRQCLDGFVMQQTNFRFEAIVHDDASTDGSAEIIKEYAEEYPDIIKPILETENQYSKHNGSLRRIMNAHTRGKYVALCEGDDYWTDPLKLQKQVDFLESHPDYSMCFHRVSTLYDGMMSGNEHFGHLMEREYSFEEIALTWSVPTVSSLFRAEVLSCVPYHPNFVVGDNVVFFTCARMGRLFCMSDCMAVYRRHEGGWSYSATTLRIAQDFISHIKALLETFPESMHGVLRRILAQHYLYVQIHLYLARPIYTLKLLIEALRLCPKEYKEEWTRSSRKMRFLFNLLKR